MSAPAFHFQNHTALFGGSFNPPHIGHVKAVKGLMKDPGVGKVIILPSFGTPLKTVGVSFEQRFEMARLAFSELSADARIELSALEKEKEIVYTWQLLEQIGARIPRLAFVIGTDQFLKLEHWGRYPDVMGMSDWIVLLRNPNTLENFQETIRKFVSEGWLLPTTNSYEFKIKISGKNGTHLRFVKTDAPAISSTDLRAKLALGKKEEAAALLPQKVLDYIERNKFYGT